MFKTTRVSLKDGQDPALILRVTMVDDELRPISADTAKEVILPEEEFHRTLREDAAERGHLITSHSTDPEWNPKLYSKNLKDDSNEECKE